MLEKVTKLINLLENYGIEDLVNKIVHNELEPLKGKRRPTLDESIKIMDAIQNDNINALELYAKEGIDFNQVYLISKKEEMVTPLIFYIINLHKSEDYKYNILKLLTSYGLNLEKRNYKTLDTILISSLLTLEYGLAKKIIRLGAKVNVTNQDNIVPVRLIFSYQDLNESTKRFYASRGRDITNLKYDNELYDLLIYRGARLSFVDEDLSEMINFSKEMEEKTKIPTNLVYRYLCKLINIKMCTSLKKVYNYK